MQKDTVHWNLLLVISLHCLFRDNPLHPEHGNLHNVILNQNMVELKCGILMELAISKRPTTPVKITDSSESDSQSVVSPQRL